MSKLFALIGATAFGYFGWWVGSYIGFVTAVFLSIIGSGIGLYFGRHLAKKYE